MIDRVAKVALLLGLTTAACGGSSSNQSIDPLGARAASGFETDAEGWTITGDAQADQVKPDFNGTGGNPDGLISAVDDVTGGVWYFQAPSKYLGDASATYGKLLTFDLKTTDTSNPFDAFDVVLVGAGVMLARDLPSDPAVNVWTSYEVPLTETDWVVISALDDDASSIATLPRPTSAEFQAVLGSLTRFLIRGEYNTGDDTGYLDNVRFGATR